MEKTISISEQMAKIAADSAFGRPLITNNYRGLLAEAIISTALGKDWKWLSADWAKCDFEHNDGSRLEVKQSAAKQSWLNAGDQPSKCAFDISARLGFWAGAVWVEGPGRNADIYVLAHHPVYTNDADHRDPEQWDFYIIPAKALPDQKTIGIRAVQKLAEPVRYTGLLDRVERARAELNNQDKI